MWWIPERNREFLDDCLAIWQNGHRRTPLGKKRWLPRRHDGWRWQMQNFTVVENARWVRGNRVQRELLRFDPHTELLFVNVDNHWGAAGRRFQKTVMAICDQKGQEYLCLSFDALRVAGLNGSARFVPIFRERLCDFDTDRLYYRPGNNTFPEATFRYVFRGQKTRYISGWDWNDRIPRYFLAELPPGAVAVSMEAARDSLMPAAVHKARLEGRRVVRQGDVFAIKTDLTEKDLKRIKRTGAAARHWRTGWRFELQQRVPSWVPADTRSRHWKSRIAEWDNVNDYAQRLKIHGTAHTATEVLHTVDGAIYGKGQMIHMPGILGENREPDHQNIRLDDGRDGWWLFVRNTVPQRNGNAPSNPF